MAYYKVKVEYKIDNSITSWFYLESDSEGHALKMLLATCAKDQTSFYPLPETMTTVSKEVYYDFLKRTKAYD